MVKRNIGNSLFKMSIAYVIATVIVKAINFMTTPIFTRLMSPKDYGVVSNFTVWGQLLAVFICGQVASGIVVAKYNNIAKGRFEKYMASIIRCAVLIGSCVSIVVIFIGFHCQILNSLKKEHFLFLCIYAFGISMGDLFSNYCIATDNVRGKVTYAIVSSLLNVILGIVCVYLFEVSSWGRIVAYGITYALIAVVVLSYFFKKPVDTKENIFKDMKFALAFGLPLVPHLIANLINGNIDRVFITEYLSEADAGIYSVAYSIGIIAFVIADACNDAWIPWFAKKNTEKDYRAISDAIQIYTVTMAMCFFGVIMLAPEIMSIMASKAYWGGINSVRYIALGIFFMFMYRFAVNYEQLNGKSIYVAPATVCAALINIGLNILFIPIMGIEGAALATTISYFGLWLFHEIVARKIIKGYEVKIKYYMSACAIMLIAFFLSKDMYDVKMTRWVMIVLACVGYGMFALKKMKDRGRDKEKEIEN